MRRALLCTVGAAATAVVVAAGVVTLARPGDDVVDRGSYAAGWRSAVIRQAPGDGAASARLRTDEMIISICEASATDGRAELNGASDTDAYLLGCRDAVTMTALEPADQ